MLAFNMGTAQIKVEDYYYLGNLHNKGLDYVVQNIDEEKFSKNLDQNVNYINDLLTSFYKQNGIHNSGSGNFQYFVVAENFMSYLNNGANAYQELGSVAFETTRSLNLSFGLLSDEPTFSSLLTNSLNQRIIDNYEFSSLVEIKKLVDDNGKGMNKTSEILEQLIIKKNQFDAKKYPTSNNAGHVLAITLAISIKSMEWWIEHEDFMTYQGTSEEYFLVKNGPNGDIEFKKNSSVVVAPWVAADVAGAVVGAAGGAISSYAGTGSVNWTSVGVSAVFGAVTGSTGVVGRLAKLIKK